MASIECDFRENMSCRNSFTLCSKVDLSYTMHVYLSNNLNVGDSSLKATHGWWDSMECFWDLAIPRFPRRLLSFAEELWGSVASGKCMVYRQTSWLDLSKIVIHLIDVVMWNLCPCQKPPTLSRLVGDVVSEQICLSSKHLEYAHTSWSRLLRGQRETWVHLMLRAIQHLGLQEK